jgi:hypothetical protein
MRGFGRLVGCQGPAILVLAVVATTAIAARTLVLVRGNANDLLRELHDGPIRSDGLRRESCDNSR